MRGNKAHRKGHHFPKSPVSHPETTCNGTVQWRDEQENKVELCPWPVNRDHVTNHVISVWTNSRQGEVCELANSLHRGACTDHVAQTQNTPSASCSRRLISNRVFRFILSTLVWLCSVVQIQTESYRKKKNPLKHCLRNVTAKKPAIKAKLEILLHPGKSSIISARGSPAMSKSNPSWAASAMT